MLQENQIFLTGKIRSSSLLSLIDNKVNAIELRNYTVLRTRRHRTKYCMNE